jgi:glyoxylase-like metal-dependent hydrolase (beta-lactamase superfamily II)
VAVLYTIEGNRVRFDGGAMFGNAPKALWSQWVRPDALNRIELATRALLVSEDEHTVLFDAGAGWSMPPRQRQRYGIEGSGNRLLSSLNELDLSHEQITGVVLSHLHFDHAGGLLSDWREGETPYLLFPKATFYVSRLALERSQRPHSRDRASFIPSLAEELTSTGRLNVVEGGETVAFGNITVHLLRSDGHTPGMLCSDIRWEGGHAVYASDLVPGRPWLHLPIGTGYDRHAEQCLDEKHSLLTSLADDAGWIVYVHDPDIAASRVTRDEQTGRFTAIEEQRDRWNVQA